MSHASAPDSLDHSYRRPPVVGVMLALSLGLNIMALILPFVVMDAAGSAPLIYGLLGSVQMLLDSQMIVLAGLVVVFSVIFPFAKLATLGWLWWRGVTTARRHSVLGWVEKLGKWSLFDVFLVAIMLGLTNDQWLISSASLPGLTCFMGAVILGMLAGERLSVVAGHPTAAAVCAPISCAPVKIAVPRSGLSLGLLMIIGVLLAAVFFLPFIQIDDWRLSNRAYSLVTLIPALWQNDSPLLAVCMGTFVIAVPLGLWLFVVFTLAAWWKRQPPALCTYFQELLERWSMLSVFALSLGVFLAEGHRFLGTQPLSGVWALAICLSLIMIVQLFLKRYSTK